MRKWLSMPAMLCIALFAMFTVADAAAPADGLAPLPGDTRPYHYQLAVTLDTEKSRYGMDAVLGFEVLKPTQRVVLNARDLSIDSARIVNGEKAQITYDAARHQVTFAFSKPLPKGKHQLAVAYSKPIDEQVEGLFKVRYPVATGSEKQMYFTFL